MPHLINYLNQFFQDSDFNSIRTHFSSEFGVDVKMLDNLYMFKYDMIDVTWNEMTEECRGIIVAKSPDWKIVSHPFDKFYNFGESRCPIKNFEPDDEFLIKADGTCIQLYYDFINSKWRVSTLGAIETTCWNSDETFEQIFYRVSNIKTNELDKNYCHMFELCAESNQVVNKYETDRVYYLKSRNLETDELVYKYSEFHGTNAMLPERFPFGGMSTEQVISAIELFGIEYGTVPEGVVVYRHGTPLAKLKRTDYLSKHAIFTGSPRFVAKNLVQQFFENKTDDYYHLLPTACQKYLDKLSQIVKEWNDESENAKSQFSGISGKTDFAKKFKEIDSNVLRKFNGFFYVNWNLWLSGETNLISWLREKNFKRAGNFSNTFRYNFEFILPELKDYYESNS